MRVLEKRVRQIEADIKPKKVHSKIWVGDSPKGYGSYEKDGGDWRFRLRNDDWTPADFNEEYEQCVIFLPAKVDLLYFRGQCEKSYLQSKGDMRHDTDRQRESQEVQQRVQG